MERILDDQIFKTGKYIINDIDLEFITYLNKTYNLDIIYLKHIELVIDYYIVLFLKHTKDLDRADITHSYTNENIHSNEKDMLDYWKYLNKNHNIKQKDNIRYHLDFQSLEHYDLGYCLRNSQPLIESKILAHYPYNIDLNIRQDASNNFLFYNHKEFKQAKKNGVFNKIRNESLFIVKSLDKLGYVNEKTYITNFYDFKNLDSDFLFNLQHG